MTVAVNSPMAGERVADMGNHGNTVFKADPVFYVQPITPNDFNAQYPTPLDPTEILAMCGDTNVWSAIPEKQTELKTEFWREMTSLAFASGTIDSYLGFADGNCPNPYHHDGANKSVTLKNIGAIKALTYSDIKHSAAVAGLPMGGINNLLGPNQAFDGLPGVGEALRRMSAGYVANLRSKEAKLGMILVMNGWDKWLVNGNKDTNPLAFDGIETLVTSGNGAHVNSNTASGTLSATGVDAFLAEACATPTHVFGHPQALQALASSYFQLGFQGSQVINYTDGNRLTPGFNFSSVINTAVGPLQLVADSNFSRTNIGGGAFQTSLYFLRMRHEGEELVYKSTQIPLSVVDLTPGCTAIQFEIWAKTALVIKHMCAHGKYTTQISGNITTTCPVIG